MILLDDVLCDSPMGDAVVHVTALDVSKDGRIRRILDVSTVEIIGGHQDEVFHDGDILARKLAHMIDRLFAKDLHGVGTHQDGLDDAWHVQVDLKAGEYIDFTILHQLPAGQAVARERTSACAAYGLLNYRGSLCPCPRAAPFVHEGMRCTVTRNSHAKHPGCSIAPGALYPRRLFFGKAPSAILYKGGGRGRREREPYTKSGRID